MSIDPQELGYDPKKLKRELTKDYISASDQDINEMLKTVGTEDLQELFQGLPSDIRFEQTPDCTEGLEYEQLIEHIQSIAERNNILTSFLGDGLQNYRVPKVVSDICQVRGLTTAYTPYQPERSQGTLMSLWIYSSTMSMLTGFEAINASLYERSTCLSEALNTTLRLKSKRTKVIVSQGIRPEEREVLHTLAKETKLEILEVPLDKKTGQTDANALEKLLSDHAGEVAGLAFCQVNCLGLLENWDRLTDLSRDHDILSIAVFDPILLGDGGLTPPSEYGSDQKGVDIIVGEAQHLCLAPNFGGPGLGVFGIRYNPENRLNIRATAGRYVGLGKDEKNQRALAMVLSTREQHIRREKATSNICSNQSFVASIAGAALLARGDKGMRESLETAHANAQSFAQGLQEVDGAELAFAETAFFNELLIQTKSDVSTLLEKARDNGLHLGVDVSTRLEDDKQAFLMSFSDIQTPKDLQDALNFLKKHLGEKTSQQTKLPTLLDSQKRKQAPGLPQINSDELKNYYHKLGRLNLSPDDNVYPLGSCTMKYNPYINDYAASLAGFTQAHPQAPVKDVQGCLFILHETQEIFKRMTGLAAVTTQPVAGAQGELVGLKMFQAYHADKGEQRDLILIPKSAHGTNPATATMAGFETKKVKGVPYGIVNVNANEKGQIDLDQIKNLVQEHGHRIAGIMVTNPNTSGIFESEFKQMAELIHSVDGLVYMDGANMNAIAGQVNLQALGVDAVHNNLHKTWTIPHGGGGPGDAIVAVSERLVDFMPGLQVIKTGEFYDWEKPAKSIGSFHRHHGNFAHKVRCYTYLKALGSDGIRRMSGMAVLSANYLLKKLEGVYPWLPQGADEVERMHEFILTLSKEQFEGIQKAGTPKAQAIAKVGKLFLDFGMHAPTVAFPEMYGMMVEPTESFTKAELDRFYDVLVAINKLVSDHPEVLTTAPHFTPVRKVDEVDANKNLTLFEKLEGLPEIAQNPVDPQELNKMSVGDVCEKIIQAHQNSKGSKGQS